MLVIIINICLNKYIDDRVQCNILEKQIKSLLKDENIPFDVQVKNLNSRIINKPFI